MNLPPSSPCLFYLNTVYIGMINVALLYGGRSGEHEVSQRSAATAARHLDRKKYHIHFIGIDKEGIWFRMDEDEAWGGDPDNTFLSIVKNNDRIVTAVPGRGLSVSGKMMEVDIVVPMLHGSFGEDGTVQGMCEILDLPYVGSDVIGSSIGIDKEKSKRLWIEAGLPVVPFIMLRKQDYDEASFSAADFMEAVKNKVGLPVFVKPCCTGSSVGVSKVRNSDEMDKALFSAFQYDSRILVEKGIEGREIECSVIGNGRPRAFPPGEILPSHEFYDYEAKYIDENGAVGKIPADIPKTVSKAIEDLAVKAYRTTGAEGFSRVDFFLENTTGKILINEINTIPGFTSISMFPKMCVSGGVSLDELLDTLISLGMERYLGKKKLKFSYESVPTSD